MVEWYVEGVEYGSCNCAFGCPCQFESVPTNGHCRGFETLRIDQGHFGDIDLSGLHVGMVYAWPGPIYEGNGELQAIIDERADTRQFGALETVLHGGETDEAATHWWVFRAMSSTVHRTLTSEFRFDVDIDARHAHVVMPGILESRGRPIQPPHSEAEHRVRIDIPGGIEFEQAEIGSATTKSGARAAIRFESVDSYGQFNRLRHSGRGLVRAA